MSTLEVVLTRATNDPQFADLLFNDLDHALAEFNPTDDEYTEFEALAVDERKSMATVPEKQIIISSYHFNSVGQ